MLFRSLKKHGFSVAALHGDMDQRVRMRTLDEFKKGEVTFLVASDVAARGLDIDDMSHVFNFDVPINAEDYIHRIGRTGRAGRSGRAITLATPDDGKFVDAIARLIGMSIPEVRIDGLDLPKPVRGERPAAVARRPRRREVVPAQDRNQGASRAAPATQPARGKAADAPPGGCAGGRGPHQGSRRPRPRVPVAPGPSRRREIAPRGSVNRHRDMAWFRPCHLTDLKTPCLILDRAVLQRNCAAMATRMTAHGVRLRPHMKTAKSADVAAIATAEHFGGITVSTLAEASYFADRGYRDLTYAVGMAAVKVDDAADVISRGARLSLLTDDPDGSAGRSGPCQRPGRPFSRPHRG